MTLIKKGTKYNIHTKKRNWIQNLALKVKTAISKLPPTEKDVYRKLTAKCISTLLHTTPTPHKTHTLRAEPSNPYKPNSRIKMP